MRLKELRKQANKTQAEVAKLLNITIGGYNQYELGRTEPNIKTLCKLADTYNVTLDYLIGRKFGNDIGFITKDQYDNIKTILSLSEKNQYKVFGYALSLLQNQN